MYDWPPESLYDTICTHKMWKTFPGAPEWGYDGQFIWIRK